MKKNIGQIDRVVRVILGAVLISFFFIFDGGVRWLSLLGVVLIVTAIVSFCPVYLPFGISTRKTK